MALDHLARRAEEKGEQCSLMQGVGRRVEWYSVRRMEGAGRCHG